MSPALRRRIRNHIFSSGVALCGGLGTAALGAIFFSCWREPSPHCAIRG